MPVFDLTDIAKDRCDPSLDRDLAVAVMVTEDGRYLLQLRDDLPGVSLRGYWGLFGGALETGESPERALRRELHEELGIDVREAHFLTRRVETFDMSVRIADSAPIHRTWRLTFFAVPIAAAAVDGLQQREGAGRGLFTIAEAMQLEKISPWDLSALMLHAKGPELFAHWLPQAGGTPR